ncbi:hypothetical protein JFK97_10805 [Chromobacterium phragmitis]|uniref:hypothetical protein n=1 Tax=Chromobacterium amazonense TaxID=1382803 RepID=UPI0021B83196|nr:hypothetical protein [Chromobacterium amazonense]MBM2884876.1 hypothetical protein [Chromobacterium amazonense]MDE1714780.1 hypothetical protein [Chromobacterium amazonense]
MMDILATITSQAGAIQDAQEQIKRDCAQFVELLHDINNHPRSAVERQTVRLTTTPEPCAHIMAIVAGIRLNELEDLARRRGLRTSSSNKHPTVFVFNNSSNALQLDGVMHSYPQHAS